jgi:hypothetical protein
MLAVNAHYPEADVHIRYMMAAPIAAAAGAACVGQMV